MEDKEKIIEQMIKDHGIVIEDFINYVIKANGIIGVGLISFADALKTYVERKIR